MSELEYSWIIDGATFQLAGELLFDFGETTKNRSRSVLTYTSCLEDFIFVVVYGDSFITAGTMPKVLGKSPGELLASHFSDLRRSPKRGVKASPGDLLLDDSFRSKIRGDLAQLDRAFAAGSSHWKEWMLREARVYLGSDATLFDPCCPRSLMKFGKTPEYFEDADLQNCIPPKFVTEIATYLGRLFRGYTEQSIQEFISRNVLSLVVVSWWFDVQSTLVPRGVRMPFALRSIIKRVSAIEPSLPKKRRTVRNLLVKNALAEMLLFYRCTRRAQILDCLATIRDQEPYVTIRRLWNDLEYEIEQGYDPGIDKIIHDIKNNCTSDYAPPDPVINDHENLLDNAEMSIRRALRQIAVSRFSDYDACLKKVFPEFSSVTTPKRSLIVQGDFISNNKGNVQARGAKAHDMNYEETNTGDELAFNLQEASEELSRMLSEMLRSPEVASNQGAVSAISCAQQAAQSNNRSEFFNQLSIATKAAGQWLCGIASKVGAKLIEGWIGKVLSP